MGGEIEIKAMVESREKLARRIESLGGKLLRQVTQEDRYLSHPCRDLRRRDEALRLRKEGVRSLLTFKGPRLGSDMKVREECEVQVNDFDSMLGILKRLGFERAFVVRKHRMDFQLEGAVVSLDSVEGLGDFVEIEITVPSLGKKNADGAEGMEELRKKLFAIASQLEVPLERFTNESYLELLASKSSSSNERR